MCIINDKADVETTNIFVAPDKDRNMQITIYSNNVKSRNSNLMILPVPNISSIQYINLENYPDIFKDLESNYYSQVDDDDDCFSASKRSLPVINVGSYKATTVSNISQIDNINHIHFGTVSERIKQILQKYYPNFGFIVCKLDASNAFKKYHPFAYKHKIYNNLLFIPTRHHHSGSSPEEKISDWDHNIYSYNTHNKHNNCKINEGFLNIIKMNKIPFNFGRIESYCKFKIHGRFKNKDGIFTVQ